MKCEDKGGLSLLGYENKAQYEDGRVRILDCHVTYNLYWGVIEIIKERITLNTDSLSLVELTQIIHQCKNNRLSFEKGVG